MHTKITALLAGTCLAASATAQQPGSSSSAEAERGQRPNFIIVLTDDQRYDALGILDPELKTPNMDRMAREGLHFANAFVTTSLCSPSRASILTGRPMREHGVIDNNSDLSEALDTFPRALQRSGYDTAMFGKWHMGGENDSPRPGFDRWVSFPGQGNYYPVSFMGGPSHLNVDGIKVEQKGYITDELTDYTLDWLEGREGDAPFMVYLSHKAVHAFFEPAERHDGMYEDMPIVDVTPSLDEMQDEPIWVQNQRNSWHGVDFPYHSTLSLPEYKRDYLETLTAVDDSLGRVFAWLEESGEADDTIVIFLSDNGFLFGEHGLIDKRNAFEESMRIPFLVWGPGRVRAGETETASVTTLDIFPTLASLASAHTQDTLRGQDIAPLLEASPAEWDDEVIYEYFWEFNYPHTPTQFAIRSDRYKYIRLHGVWDTDALYDLEADPGETNNLIDNPDYLEIRLDLQRRLHDAIERGDGKGEVPFTYKFTQGAVFRSPEGAPTADFPKRWMRENDAPDRLEHIVPDSLQKPQILKQINTAVSDQSEE